MDKLKKLKDLYDSIKEEPVYAVRYESTGKIRGYQSAPELLLGKVPIYEKSFVVRELSLKKKDELFSVLLGTYGERIFSDREEAEQKAEWLNTHDNELDLEDLLL